jgi:hypothetical protein
VDTIVEDGFASQPVSGVHEITCTGLHREMGRQQGRVLAEVARRGLGEVIFENDRIDQIKPRLLPRAAFLAAGKWLAGRTIPRDVERYYPRQYSRFLGIADGAGLDIDHIWMTLLMEQRAQASLRMPACTTFALTEDRTTFAQPVIARVFDLPAETKPFNTLRWDRPTDGIGSMQVTFPQLAGSHTGVNEHGLCIAYNLGYPRDDSGCRTSITLIVQELLEEYRTVSDAIDRIKRSPRAGGALLTLADAKGQIAAVELTSTQTAVRYPDDGCVINSNHYQSDLTRPTDTAFGQYAWPWQYRDRHWIGPSSLARLERASLRLRERRRWDIDGLIAIMADHGETGVGSDMTICRHAPPYETTLAAILLPNRRTMLIAPGQACCQSFVARPLERPS